MGVFCRGGRELLAFNLLLGMITMWCGVWQVQDQTPSNSTWFFVPPFSIGHILHVELIWGRAMEKPSLFCFSLHSSIDVCVSWSIVYRLLRELPHGSNVIPIVWWWFQAPACHSMQEHLEIRRWKSRDIEYLCGRRISPRDCSFLGNKCCPHRRKKRAISLMSSEGELRHVYNLWNVQWANGWRQVAPPLGVNGQNVEIKKTRGHSPRI